MLLIFFFLIDCVKQIKYIQKNGVQKMYVVVVDDVVVPQCFLPYEFQKTEEYNHFDWYKQIL